MSVTRGRNPELDYTDFEIQNIGIRKEGGLGGPDGTSASRNDFDVTEPGLDHNEVAELVFMYRDWHLGYEPDSDNFGSIEGSASLGINLDTDEDITSDQPFATGITHETDRRGQLDFVNGIVTSGYEDGVNSTGGGGNTAFESRTMNWRHHFGSGPVFDSNDDLTIRTDLEKDTAGASIAKNYYTVQLGWVVHTVEDARPQFGMPR